MTKGELKIEHQRLALVGFSRCAMAKPKRLISIPKATTQIAFFYTPPWELSISYLSQLPESGLLMSLQKQTLYVIVKQTTRISLFGDAGGTLQESIGGSVFTKVTICC